MKCAYPIRIDPEITKYLPMVQYKGDVVVVDNAANLDEIMGEISNETVLGFDTETRPSFRKGVHYNTSLLQLCGENRAWLFKLDPLKDVLEKVFSVLANENIVKCGVAVSGDISGLKSLCEFEAKGFVEISDYTQKMGILNTGLKNLSCVFFGERISKSVQMSNWASETLSPRQITYAATDAWISRRLYLEVKARFGENNYELQAEYPEIAATLLAKVKLAFKKIRNVSSHNISGIKKFVCNFSKNEKKAFANSKSRTAKRPQQKGDFKRAPKKYGDKRPQNRAKKDS